jgi:hypothetical protein
MVRSTNRDVTITTRRVILNIFKMSDFGKTYQYESVKSLRKVITREE